MTRSAHLSLGRTRISSPRAGLLIAGATATLVRIAFFARFASGRRDPAAIGGGDGGGYYALARHLADHHDFNHPLFLLRPPGFPALVALVMFISRTRSAWTLIGVNFALSIVAVGLTYLLAQALRLSNGQCLAAALIVACDPAAGFLAVAPLSDTMLVVCTIGAFLGIVRVRHSDRPLRWAFLIGALIALGMMTKPVLIWFAVPLALLLAIDTRKFAAATIVVLFAAGTFGAWSASNQAKWGTRTFSSAGVWTLYFGRCTSILHFDTGEKPKVIQQRLADDLSLAVGRPSGSATLYDYVVTTDPRVLKEMDSRAKHIIATHFGTFVKLYPVGIVRMGFASPDGSVPGIPFVLFFVLLYGLAVASARRWWRADRWFLMVVATTIVYFVGVTTTAETAALSLRMAEPFVPLLAILAVGNVDADRLKSFLSRGVRRLDTTR